MSTARQGRGGQGETYLVPGRDFPDGGGGDDDAGDADESVGAPVGGAGPPAAWEGKRGLAGGGRDGRVGEREREIVGMEWDVLDQGCVRGGLWCPR